MKTENFYTVLAQHIVDNSKDRAQMAAKFAEALQVAYNNGVNQGSHNEWVKVWDADKKWQDEQQVRQQREQELEEDLNRWRYEADQGELQ